jgi:hypothetical protein
MIAPFGVWSQSADPLKVLPPFEHSPLLLSAAF